VCLKVKLLACLQKFYQKKFEKLAQEMRSAEKTMTYDSWQDDEKPEDVGVFSEANEEVGEKSHSDKHQKGE
jgi:hypothetical protein